MCLRRASCLETSQREQSRAEFLRPLCEQLLAETPIGVGWLQKTAIQLPRGRLLHHERRGRTNHDVAGSLLDYEGPWASLTGADPVLQFATMTALLHGPSLAGSRIRRTSCLLDEEQA